MFDGVVLLVLEVFNVNQCEKIDFQILMYQQKVLFKLDYQVLVFCCVSCIDYMFDLIGDFVYNGVVVDIMCCNEVYGVQGDVSYKLIDKYMLCVGVFVQCECYVVDNIVSVFVVDSIGVLISIMLFIIVDNYSGSGIIMGVYL